MNIIRASDYDDLSRKAANIISAQVVLSPRCVLGLATGSTPLGIYRQLADRYQQGDVDFSSVCSVNLDEYCDLSPDNDQSYHYYMREYLFKHINIKPSNTHLPNGLAEDFDAECSRYDALIDELGGTDLQLLGLGHTGHIGFNEPDDSFSTKTHRVRLADLTVEANARFFKNKDEVPRYAVTMGIKGIMQARKIILAVSGQNKAEILERSLFGPVTPKVPASILQLHPSLVVVADSQALTVCIERHPAFFAR